MGGTGGAIQPASGEHIYVFLTIIFSVYLSIWLFPSAPPLAWVATLLPPPLTMLYTPGPHSISLARLPHHYIALK